MKEDTTTLKEQIRNKSMEPIVPADMQKESHYYSGITQLEYFAAMAMQGICANSNSSYDRVHNDSNKDQAFSDLITSSFNIAEAMIEESIKRSK